MKELQANKRDRNTRIEATIAKYYPKVVSRPKGFSMNDQAREPWAVQAYLDGTSKQNKVKRNVVRREKIEATMDISKMAGEFLQPSLISVPVH